MEKYTDEQLAKLRKYFEKNAYILAEENRIKQFPYYPDNEEMREYLWTIIEVKRLGRIEMYFTGESSKLSINGISVEKDRVESFNFREIESIILNAYKNKKIEDSKNWFDEN